jgi:hypothetical protein
MVRVLAGVVVCTVLAAGAAFAQQPADADRPTWGGDVSFSVDFSEGTQRGRTVKSNVLLGVQTPLFPAGWRARTKFRGEGVYVSGEKPLAPKVVSNEMLFGEIRQDFHGPPLWIFVVASGYHHLAFALRSQQAYGAGVSYALPKVVVFVLYCDLLNFFQ